MYESHFEFNLPEDDNIKVWRYLDFTKFIALLETQSLYFCRADKFEDPFEGTLPVNTAAFMSSMFDGEFDNAQEMSEQLKLIFNFNRKLTLINCWHINSYESDAMWKLYSNIDFGIVIESSIGRLKNAFNKTPETIYIGEVKYIDYENENLESISAFTPFLYKRKSFEHEREIRAIYWDTIQNDHLEEAESSAVIKENLQQSDSDITAEILLQPVSHGKNFPVDLDMLIERIHISPIAPEWFVGLVKTVTNLRYSFKKPIIQSRLYKVDEEPNNSANSVTLQEKLILTKEVLEVLNKKDAARIAKEKEERDRLIQRQSESITYDYEELNKIIESLEYTSEHIIYKSAEALLKFSSDFVASNSKIEFFQKPFFNSIYFLTGRFDNIMRDTLLSVLPDFEKRTLYKRIIFLYTSVLCLPLTNILVICQAEEIEYPHLELIANTFNKFRQIMNEESI